MWKVVLADDENLILRGLKRLIDWDGLNLELVGEATDGERLWQEITEKDPDLVITDIMMPGKTGLEVIRECRESGSKVKFIFVSGYQEFSYAQEALQNGAVDYLLKPVGKKDIEQAVKKAVGMLKEQNTAALFSGSVDDIQQVFHDINNGHEYEDEDLYELFRSTEIDFEDRFFVAICAGICPDLAERMGRDNFGLFNLQRFSVFNQMGHYFGIRKNGFVIKKDKDVIILIGVFPNADRDCYIGKYVEPALTTVEAYCQTKICAGIGTPVDDPKQIMSSYKNARFAFELYFFEEKPVIDYLDIHKEYRTSFEDYKEYIEDVFRGIVIKDPNVQDRIDRVMDAIHDIHYGNWQAVRMRTMNFTGELTSKLKQYNLWDDDFYAFQDQLQRKVEEQMTMSDLRKLIRTHFQSMIDAIYETNKSKDKLLIQDVKNYITEHYAENLSIKELADVACVSPNYFSAMFKKETGENYKTFLTKVRVDKALELLQTTDLKTYEIGERVGYNNVRRFVDAFKQVYQVSPMEYKKNLQS